GFRRIGVAHQKRFARHDLPRGAEAALRPVVLDERLLDGIELVALGKPVDSENLLAAHPDRELAARIHVTAVDEYRAGAALAAVATDARAREAELVAQDLGERLAVLHLDAVGLAVHLQRHDRSPLGGLNLFGRIGLRAGRVEQALRDHRRADRARADALQEIAPRNPFAFFLVHGEPPPWNSAGASV